MDVSPVVDLGRHAAKAMIGEPLPVRASVFREGHDQLSAEVVLTDPGGVQARSRCEWRKHETTPDLYEAWVTPDLEGAWTYRDPGVVRPDGDLAARRRASRSRPASTSS